MLLSILPVLTILTIVNTIAIILVAVKYFREHYTIVDLETWNQLAHFYNEQQHQGAEDETQEAAGGTGFFWDYVSDLEVDSEEEENKKKNIEKLDFNK